MPYSDVKINGRSVNWVKLNGKTWWEKSAPVQYRYIDPVDAEAFPAYTGLWLITLNGSESWSASGGGCYTGAYADVIRNQDRASVIGFSADYTFYPSITSLESLPQDGFMFNGTTSNPVNGNLSFKGAHTTAKSEWVAYLAEHPIKIIISVNNPDQSVWKPALAPAKTYTAGGVTYTAIKTADAAAYPEKLTGWAKCSVNRATSTASGGNVATVDTGVRGAYPSTCYASTYDGCENTKSLSAQPDVTVKYGFSTDSYRDRIYIKDLSIAPTLEAWNAHLAANPIDVLFELETSDGSEWVAVTDGTTCGYLNAATGEYCAVYGMSGTPAEQTGYWNGADAFVAVHGGIPYYGDNLITQDVIDGAYDNAWISTGYVWTNASGSASFPVPVTVGKRYRIAWDATDSATVGAVFRYGFTDNNTPSSSNTLSTPRARTTPQDTQSVEVEASKDYLIIQVTSGSFPENTGHLTVREMVGYDNSDELLTLLTGDNGGANSATMLNTLGGR